MPRPLSLRVVVRSVLSVATALMLTGGATLVADDAPATDARSRAINEKLEEKIPLQFPNATPLEDVLKYVQSASQGPNDSGIPYAFDEAGMKRAGKDRNVRVDIDSTGEPLKTSLRNLLKPLGLTYEVRKGVLTVTDLPKGAK